MILKFLVLTGLAVYLGIRGEWIYSLWAISGFIPRYGVALAAGLAITLLISSYTIAGIVLALLIAFNVTGNEIVNRIRRSKYEDTSDVTINFVRYCKEYFVIMCGFLEEDADIAVLDPVLGSMMDEIKAQWAREMAQAGQDVDDYLLEFKFRSPEMKLTNETLDQYWKMYKSRKEEVLEYLREIGHPMGYSGD